MHLSWLQHSTHLHQSLSLDVQLGREYHLQVLKHIQGPDTADLSHESHFVVGRVKGSWEDPGQHRSDFSGNRHFVDFIKMNIS